MYFVFCKKKNYRVWSLWLSEKTRRETTSFRFCFNNYSHRLLLQILDQPTIRDTRFRINSDSLHKRILSI